jgi:UDP-N-acetylmuramoyl-tripeptide--D-alanyl-D-alanine ligase
MEFTVADLLDATRGCLLQGEAATVLRGATRDSREVRPGDLFVAVAGEKFDGHRFVASAFEAGAAAAVVSKSPIPDFRFPISDFPNRKSPLWPLVLVDDTVAAYGELGAWWRTRVPARVVGVTGSNGKTTTKEMTAHLLSALGPTVCSEANHNNHFGVPETLLRIEPHHRFAVVEMGTNHFGELPALARLVRPDVGLITNVGPAHLEAFGSEEGVAREKGRLLDFIASGGLAVLHADDPWSWRLAEGHAGRKATFGFSERADWRATDFEQGPDSIRFTVERTGDVVTVPVVGRWQVANCLAALAVASEMGLSVREAAERFKVVQTPEWRMDIRRFGDVTLLLDCYNANPASMRGAIEVLASYPCPGRRVAVLGDMLELGGASEAAHREIGGLVASSGVDLLCAVGEAAFFLVGEALSQGMSPSNVSWSPDCESAAPWLKYQLEPADTVLFKASRGVRLEEVAAAAVAWAEAHAGPEAERAAASASR